MNLTPNTQLKLYGLDNYLLELIKLFEKNNLPNKIILSGDKGSGKATMAYHLINYVLSYGEEFSYDPRFLPGDVPALLRFSLRGFLCGRSRFSFSSGKL